MPGKQVCRFHGGRAGRPPIHGKRSRVLGRLAEAYNSGLEQKEALLDLYDTLAVYSAIVDRIAERFAGADTPEFRSRALGLARLIAKALEGQEIGDRVKGWLADLLSHLEIGGEEDAALAKLQRTVQDFSTMQEGALKHRLHAQQAMQAVDVQMIIADFLEVVVEEVSDHLQVQRVMRRIEEKLARGSQMATARMLEIEALASSGGEELAQSVAEAGGELAAQVDAAGAELAARVAQ